MTDHATIPDAPSDDPATGETAALLAALRRALRGAGWTQSRLAAELGVGSATVKRWLHGRGLSLNTLGRLATLAGTSLAELTDESRLAAQENDHLTLAQEEALTQDPNISTIFFLIVKGWPLSEATEGFHIPPEVVERHVAKLERLALVDRLPGGRVRARLSPAHAWQRVPMRRHFERNLKQFFSSIDYADPQTIFGAETVKLSPLGVARMRERIEAFRADLRAIELDDRRTAALPGEWHAVLAVARSMKTLIGP
ncbi:transcriptional regulator with XRE-family HTH domain [Sphingomonas zeicaulis]|uniref:helix-turn-helix domain-containing protein n=1 Tax=Sphingomonas zeicaulis TaxID=1632740 RepID=UPI003D1BB9B9